MELRKDPLEQRTELHLSEVTASKKRRLRRKKALEYRIAAEKENISNKNEICSSSNTGIDACVPKVPELLTSEGVSVKYNKINDLYNEELKRMSSKENKSREEIKAAREAKKLAKQKAKTKCDPKEKLVEKSSVVTELQNVKNPETSVKHNSMQAEISTEKRVKIAKSKDEVDKVVPLGADVNAKYYEVIDKTIEAIKTTREANKSDKKKIDHSKICNDDATTTMVKAIEVAETLDKIVDVVKEMKQVSEKFDAFKISDTGRKEETIKSKAELKAERRAKQEAQRAAKMAAVQNTTQNKIIEKTNSEKKTCTVSIKEETKMPKKSSEKTICKIKSQRSHRVDWFQHLYDEREEALHKRIGINSNLHPVIVRLGVQLASRVVCGSNARCIALLNALKQVVKDYTLPAKTEFSRGLEAYLAPSLKFLWSMRKPSSSQTNAVKFFRYQLTQLPNNVNEFDAKKTLQEAIDIYIREQIDMAGQAISLSVRKKISNGDNILTYGCSSLVERIIMEAWSAGVQFRALIVGVRGGGGGGGGGGRQLLRRLRAHGVPCSYLDLSAVSFVMSSVSVNTYVTVSKVIVGASSLLVNGWVMGAAGTALLALTAREHNVPVLVCCERHKVSERVQTDAFVYNELGDPDELIDESDEDSPLREWRSNPNLTLLNLMYDVTPPSLVTAVITDLAILPCSSAPVVLRFMLSEYGF